ncbi:cytochrome P450 [Musa troglodytarum]|uniref:Cytochrome P450 n=1 Tax=Musa troglodytarum TaxID=320322 RepID=A0A9E7GBZ9_9LILI|nr:cytochrome P450 [Musa troglodytarum]URE11890.1 cytochrome P450 [Musa troglodytarum]
MRTHLVSSLLLLMLFLGAANQASWLFLFLLFALSFLFPLLFTIWLVPGGFAWHRYSGAGSIAPGPIGWPLLGCLTVMGPLAHRKLAKLSKSHGAAHLMALSLGATPVVVSSHPDTAREILHGPAFSDRPAKISARMLMFERAIGFAAAGDYWRHLRRVASTSMFSPRRIAALASFRHQVAGRMVGRVWKEMEGMGLVVLRELLQESCLENMVGSVFGLSLGEAETKELVGMVRKGYELIGQFNLEDYFPLGGLLDLSGVGRRCKHLSLRVKDLVGKIVERRRQGDYRMQDDFLSLLLSLPKEETLSDADIIAVLWEMVFRGTDAVAVLLEWTMARMVLHPNIQTKAQQELDAVVGGRPVEDSDTPKLRYLQAVVKEVLRMHPPGPLLSWARLAVRDVLVGKYFVPAGTTAMVNMWAITHDESNWEDPWAFRPDRFLEADVSVLGSDLRLSPFGSGRRVCPGRALGVTTAHLWLARLLQQFRWTAGRPVQLSERLRLSLEMKKPLACRVVRRGRVDAE